MSDTVYVLDQVGIRLVKEKTLISDTQLKRPEQVVGFVSDILREYDRESTPNQHSVIDILPMCSIILIQEIASLSSGVLRTRGLFIYRRYHGR